LIVFPAISAAISLLCAGLIARDAIARPRPDKVTWAVAFAIFAIAAGTEVMASATEWSVTLARVYYLTGAVLVVGFLALGELYLLAASRIQKFAPGVILLVTAVSGTVVFNAGIDRAKLAEDGWEAIERGPALTALAIGINSLGTLVIAGGLIYSAVKFKRLGIQRNRMLGCVLIALGTVVVAMGGTATRFGHREYLYIPMAIGVAIIFGGYVQSRRPDTVAKDLAPVSPLAVVRSMTAKSTPTPRRATGSLETALEFVEAKLLALDEERVSELCREWSVERDERPVFDREEARSAWSLRSQLSSEAQARFDALPLAVRRQISELFHEVLVVATGKASA
jgi:hypothetical protein